MTTKRMAAIMAERERIESNALLRLAAVTNEISAISKPYGSAILKDDYISNGIPVVRGINLALEGNLQFG